MDAEETAHVAELYHALAQARQIILQTADAGPNDVARVYGTARQLRDVLIPAYINGVPLDVREYLDIDLHDLTDRCVTILGVEPHGLRP